MTRTPNHTVIELMHHRVTVGELREKLDSRELATLAACSILQNDVNVLSKLIMWTGRDDGIPPEVGMFSLLQRSLLLRFFVLRTYEFKKVAYDCKGVHSDLGRLAQTTLEEISAYKKAHPEGVSLAKRVRDGVAAHTSFKDVKRALKDVSDDFDASSFVMPNQLDTIYALGEEAVFFANLKPSSGHQTSIIKQMLKTVDWCVVVVGSLTRFHLGLRQLLSERIETTSNVEKLTLHFKEADLAPYANGHVPLAIGTHE